MTLPTPTYRKHTMVQLVRALGVGAFLAVSTVASTGAAQSCPPDYPQLCGTGCAPAGAECCANGKYCPSGSYCNSSGGCTSNSGSGGSGGGGGGSGTCPSSHPVDCGNGYCCDSSHPYCCSNGTCSSTSSCSGGGGGGGGGGGYGGGSGTCPSSHPVDCGNGYCCDSSHPYCCSNGTCSSTSSCNGGGGGGGGYGGGTSTSGGYTCSSTNVQNANCSYIKYCIANDASSSYYEADGHRFHCTNPQDVSGCAQNTVDYCSSTSGSSYNDPNTSSGCAVTEGSPGVPGGLSLAALLAVGLLVERRRRGTANRE
jgi:MYXO-CTERM domain-containing protein